MTNFKKFGLPGHVEETLDRMKITVPTPIQVEAIPYGLIGQDILASAQTGTGKTIAYMIPLVIGLMNKPESTALVLTPTRELAAQVRDAWNLLTVANPKLKAALLIGGEPMPRQFDQLKRSPKLVVGTPGRVMDHLKRRTLKLHHTHFLVLDETDRMLDMGFSDQIEKIVKLIPEKRQTFMFSATLPFNIISLAKKYLTNPKHITVGDTTQPIAEIKQEVLKISSKDKYDTLLGELDKRDGSIIIFVKTKIGAKNLAIKLHREKHIVDAIHGDLRQQKRDKVLNDFRTSRIRILVATDVAARGLDIPHIKHVINYDMPQCTDDYIHRVGRTGRAGAEGCALCLVTPEERYKWEKIYKMMNPAKDAARPEHHHTSSATRKPAGKRPWSGKPSSYSGEKSGSGRRHGSSSSDSSSSSKSSKSGRSFFSRSRDNRA